MKSSDFTDKPRSGEAGWWNWKPAKIALEHLFHQGRITVVHRRGFQKVYDLSERVLPGIEDLPDLSSVDLGGYLIDSTLDNLIIARESDMLRQRPDGKPGIGTALEEKVFRGEIQKISIEGNTGWYVRSNILDTHSIPDSLNSRVLIFNPFDNLVINRSWLSVLLGFDYTIECYVPAARRQRGYYALPILWIPEADKGMQNIRFMGTVDCKALRKEKILEIRNISRCESWPSAFQETFSRQLEVLAHNNKCLQTQIQGEVF
ncbi:hypothetical protein JCM12856_27810 [Spirochaeta dissipatitropha]